MTIFYEGWQEKEYSCGICDWKGNGGESSRGLFYRKMYLELFCPGCNSFLDLIIFPESAGCDAMSETLAEEQKQALLEQEEQMRQYRERCLKAPDQLPELTDEEFVLLWDQVEGDTQIRNGDLVIWSEPVAYEGFERYERIALILKEKYGARVRDLQPTDRSMLFLHGDFASSLDFVAKVRKELFGVE
ncbi:MAG TPA: hypothetical protein VFG19_12235 [Geobacteraceae bacterium]|nr:hypothetical protein [Geobacteraceae bacterium]